MLFRLTLRFWFLCLCFLSITASTCHSKPVKKVFVEQAVALFKAGNYEAALSQFRGLLESSTSKEQRRRLQWNVARCLEMLGRSEEALAEFYAYESTIKDAKRQARAKRKIRSLIPKVYGDLHVKCKTAATFQVELKPHSNPTASQKFNAQKCPGRLKKLKSGEATVTAWIGKRIDRRKVDIRAGQTAVLHMQIPATPPASGESQGFTRNQYIIGGSIAAVAVGTLVYFLVSDDGGSEQKTSFMFE